MRMWMVDPEIMCQKHLLGEHVECHMFVGTILKNKSLDGYVENGLVEAYMLLGRHNELVEEMENRGYNHNSPLADYVDELADYPTRILSAEVDKHKSLMDLISRCPACAQKYYDYITGPKNE